MSQVVDASVVLAVILEEPGAASVLDSLDGALISTVNLSEVYRRLVESGVPLSDAIAEAGRFQMRSVAFDDEQAAEAARLRPLTRYLGLSFADRACLALAGLRKMPVLTADREWAKLDIGLDIRLIR